MQSSPIQTAAPAAGAAASATGTGTSPAAHGGGFTSLVAGLLNLPGGSNGRATSNPVPAPLRLAASAASSALLANPFGIVSTLFMSFAQEILEMGPDTSRPAAPAGMSVTGSEAGVQPTSPGTLKDGAYLSLATTPAAFLTVTAPDGSILPAATAAATATATDGSAASRTSQADGPAAPSGTASPSATLPASAPPAAPGTAGIGALAFLSTTGSEAGMLVGLPTPYPLASTPAAPASPAPATTPPTPVASAATPAAPPAAAAPTPAAPTPRAWATTYAAASEWERARMVERGLA